MQLRFFEIVFKEPELLGVTTRVLYRSRARLPGPSDYEALVSLLGGRLDRARFSRGGVEAEAVFNPYEGSIEVVATSSRGDPSRAVTGVLRVFGSRLVPRYPFLAYLLLPFAPVESETRVDFRVQGSVSGVGVVTKKHVIHAVSRALEGCLGGCVLEGDLVTCGPRDGVYAEADFKPYSVFRPRFVLRARITSQDTGAARDRLRSLLGCVSSRATEELNK